MAANQLVVVSPILKQYYQDQFSVASHFIPNGVVPIERSRPNRMLEFGLQPKKYLLAVARLVPEKGLHYLIEAFTKTSGDMKLVIAGGGGLDASYEQQLRSLANDRVVFTGPADRGLLAELYSHARMFVLPSDLEGMSIALLEAMSMGLPILVSDIPENTTVIGDAGESFAAANVASLREKLEEMLAQPERLDMLGQMAAEKAEPFQWPNVVDQLEAVYEQCLVGRKRQASPARERRVPQTV